MAWDAKYLPDDKIALFTATSAMSSADAIEQIKEAVRLLKENETNVVLCDYSHVETKIPVVDLYSLPQRFLELGLSRSMKAAMVLPETGHRYEDYVFFENRMRNDGFNVKLFNDIQTAKEWLFHKEKA